jgi:hypothetical protein
MRTTLDLDDDLLELARQLALQRKSSIGQVISDLARKSLNPKVPTRVRNGVPVFTPKTGARKPHLKIVNELRDEG